jgi:hypothetical protein
MESASSFSTKAKLPKRYLKSGNLRRVEIHRHDLVSQEAVVCEAIPAEAEPPLLLQTNVLSEDTRTKRVFTDLLRYLRKPFTRANCSYFRKHSIVKRQW